MLEVRTASRADNDQLLSLTRTAAMPGVIGLRIDRDPDFCRLLSLRGEGTVLVQEEGGEIRGCISLSKREVWAAGAQRSLWYVGDMKVRPEARNEGVGAALAVGAFRYLMEAGGDLLVCVVAQGNRRVLTFLGGRFEIPPFSSLGRFSVLMMLTSRRSPGTEFVVRDAAAGDCLGLAELYRESSRRFQLSPVLEEEDWRRAVEEDPTLCQVLVAEREGQVLAAGWLFDVQWAKQHVVLSMSRLSPAFRIPRQGEVVSLLALRHLAVRGERMGALRALVQEARRRAHAGGFPFVIYGVHGMDPFSKAFRGLPHFTMGSEVFLTSLQGNSGLVEEAARGIPVEDYALT
jgi:ribosomal protein S18 acetylase RimI-like enzyme